MEFTNLEVNRQMKMCSSRFNNNSLFLDRSFIVILDVFCF